jgi:formamidopyrimidine-DNA glycosylase
MPEGPEVRLLVDLLNKKFKNGTIKYIEILGGKYLRKKADFSKLKELKINSINCYGKFIYWLFNDSDIVLFNTLGMTGWWNYATHDNDMHHAMNHNNVKFIIDDNIIYFNDPRNFGNIIISNKSNLDKKLAELGADIFNKDHLDIFIERLKKKRDDSMICTALLDQKVIAGCGNYLRAEALYIAKISPFRTINNLSKDEMNKLFNILLQLAWFYYNEEKGRKLNIIDNKYQLNALFKKTGPGNYKSNKDYENYFHVYRQKIDRLGNKVLKKEINNRTIHYVPNIQI